jgi:hypothetical protein
MAHMEQKPDDEWVLRDDWHVEDVESRLEYFGFELTEKECIEVLQLVAKTFDAEQGINWDSIDCAIDVLFGYRKEKEWTGQIRMRSDLIEEELAVPASRTFSNYDTQVDVVYITAEELEGADYGDDPADPDDHPFCYVKLKDGRSLYFLSIDLDFRELSEEGVVHD